MTHLERLFIGLGLFAVAFGAGYLVWAIWDCMHRSWWVTTAFVLSSAYLLGAILRPGK